MYTWKNKDNTTFTYLLTDLAHLNPGECPHMILDVMLKLYGLYNIRFLLKVCKTFIHNIR